MLHKQSLSSLAIAVGLALSGNAIAAEEATAEEKAEHRGLEVIEVTVERRVQSIQDYAGVAQSLDESELKNMGITADIRNLGNAVPGLSIAKQEGNVEVYIRGVGNSNNTELGDAAAAFHINGIYIPRMRGIGMQFYDVERVEVNKGPQGTLRGRNATAGSLNVISKKPEFDEFTGMVEVGYGNYDTINYDATVNIPVADNFAIRVAGQHQAHDSYFDNASPVKDLTPAGEEDNIAGRISALWEPNSDSSLYIVADYTEETGTGYPGANAYEALQNGHKPDDLNNPRNVLYHGTQGDMYSRIRGIVAQYIYDFDGFSVEASSSFRDLNFEQQNAQSSGMMYPGRDNSGQEWDLYSNVLWEQTSNSRVNELRFFSTGDGPLIWTAGVFYYDEDQETVFFSFADRSNWYQGTEFTMPTVETESKAGYIDMTYNITNDLRVMGGYRRTNEEKHREGIGGNYGFGWMNSSWSESVPNENIRFGTEGYVFKGLDRDFSFLKEDITKLDAEALLLSGVKTFGARDTIGDYLAGGCEFQGAPCNQANNSTLIKQKGRSEFDFNDWRVGIAWDWADDSMVYANIATGHKSGGFNDTHLVDGELITEEYSPEKLTMYEIGSKNDLEFMGTPMRLNVSAFYYDYEDQVFQLVQQVGECPECEVPPTAALNVNVADSEIKGLEIESKTLLPYDLTFDMTMLFLDAEIDSGIVSDARQSHNPGDLPEVDLSGNTLPKASDFTANLKLTQYHDFEHGSLDWMLAAQYRSSYYLSIFNGKDYESDPNPGFDDKVDGYWHADFGVGYSLRDGAIRFEGYVNNIFDETHSDKAIMAPGLNLRFYNLPRTYGVRMRTYF
ncbi:TonB-dependent receptor [Neiella sp. HB171785]|uniref:TonB-dependent receptor n=1 Tax=Neiella litorisoli TaxID=2771431 RepID=A0A8J6QKL1_9GAMM|nr:TonB-dependent receptor plug domain-containing protein [Neiella litorisoli]MBD1391073.1 TonB-dependent receptor [Neiella litorisoli]